MYHSLRVGNVNAFAVEEVVNALLHFKEDIPIVGIFHPHTDDEIHAAVGQFVQSDEGAVGLGVLKNARIGPEESQQLFAHTVHVLTIVHADGPLHTAVLFLGIVHHHGGAQRTVGHIHLFVVGCEEYGVENLDFVYLSLHSLRLNPVAHTVGLEKEND